MSNDTYNGHANYETWLASLWMDNDEGSQSYWHDEAEAALISAKPSDYLTSDEMAVIDLSKILDEWLDTMAEEAGGNTGLLCDLLTGAIGRIDTHEIAKSLIESVTEEA